MGDILTRVLDNPATSYILSFGGLGLVLVLAINGLHKYFKLPERTWGLLILLSGAIGGTLLQEVGFVSLPGGSTIVSHLLSAIIGSACAAAAAGFSSVDLRSTFKSTSKRVIHG